MRTVVLEVRSLAETLADASRAMKTGRGERDSWRGRWLRKVGKLALRNYSRNYSNQRPHALRT